MRSATHVLLARNAKPITRQRGTYKAHYSLGTILSSAIARLHQYTMPSDLPVVVVAAFVLYIISSLPLQQVSSSVRFWSPCTVCDSLLTFYWIIYIFSILYLNFWHLSCPVLNQLHLQKVPIFYKLHIHKYHYHLLILKPWCSCLAVPLGLIGVLMF